KALAIYDPREASNNKFGIHVIDENDFEDAAKLVNSEGGDWGYVTLVIREDERDAQRWARAFEKMTDLHLIPIVRIASLQSQKGWTQGKISEIENWVDFLDTLPWSTRNRYIVIGNETN